MLHKILSGPLDRTDIEWVVAAVAQKADVNGSDANGDTPLHILLQNRWIPQYQQLGVGEQEFLTNQHNLVHCLLDKGGDPRLKNRLGVPVRDIIPISDSLRMLLQAKERELNRHILAILEI